MPYKLPKNQYPFPLNYYASDGGTDLTPFVAGDPTVEAASNNWYILCLTPDELIDVMSLVEVGTPIVFPDNYNTLQQKFWQMREFPNQIPEDSCMDLCQLIIDCINTTPELQQLIGQFSLTSAITDTTTENEANLATSFVQGQPDCDNDKLYGMCLQLTQLLNTVSENLLDIFVAGLAQASNLGDLIEAIPVVGELPLDDILQFLAKMAGQVNTAYQAAYDTQLEEDISCLFFCEASIDCELTFEDARDIIKDLIANPVSAQDFVSMVNDIIANNWIGEQSVYLFFYFILETIIFGGEILGQDVNRFATTVATYFNDPNPDWETLCTCCEIVEETWDFTVSSQSPTWNLRAGVDGSSYVASEGYRGTLNGGTQIWTDRYAKILEVTGTVVVSSGSPEIRLQQYVDATNTVGALIGFTPFDGNVDINTDLLITGRSNPLGATVTLTELTIKGCLA